MMNVHILAVAVLAVASILTLVVCHPVAEQTDELVANVTQLRAKIDELVANYDNLADSIGPRYFVSWRSLDLPSSPTDVQSCQVGDQSVLVVTSHSSGEVCIYNSSTLSIMQTLAIAKAVETRGFSLNGEAYLAVAVSGPVSWSRVYRWHGSSLGFMISGIVYDITDARGVDVLSSKDHGTMVALKVPLHFLGLLTRVYRVAHSSRGSVELNLVQQLDDTIGTDKMHFFDIDSKVWLSITRACAYCSNSQSIVYQWVNDRFLQFQSFPQARDLYPITLGCDVLLVAVGIQEGAYAAKSVVYIYDRVKRLFEEFQVLDDPDARTVRHLVIRREHFLLLSGFADGPAANATGRLYRMSGRSFSLYQEMKFLSDVSSQAFFKSDKKYILSVAHGDRQLALYKWNGLSDSCIV